MNDQEIKDLLKRYEAGSCTPEEKERVERLFLWHFDQSADARETGEYLKRRSLTFKIRTWMPTAAALLLLISWAYYHYKPKAATGRIKNQEPVELVDVAPGGNKAVLTLGNGRQIQLDSSKEAIVVEMGRLTYADGSKLSDQTDGIKTSAPNVLSTPKGGKYRIVLSDGTVVWLNSEGTLKYPSTFTGDTREVELEGEAYFSVNRNSSLGGRQKTNAPFVVRTKNQSVTVLGTEFNVAAYADEKTVKTTLREGKVKVTGLIPQVSCMLLPNEQAVMDGKTLTKSSADADLACAWKDDKFKFHETELREVMKQLSRWYDLEVSYEGPVPLTYFYGEISRDKSLNRVLDILRESGLHFKIEKNGDTNKLTVQS